MSVGRDRLRGVGVVRERVELGGVDPDRKRETALHAADLGFLFVSDE